MTPEQPIFEQVCAERRVDPFAVAASIRGDIAKASDHTDGRPWPEWGQS